MNLANKALWYVETHLGEPVGLDEIATACGISRFHLTRTFGAATGYSVVRYLSSAYSIPESRFVIAGYGEYRPIAANDSIPGRARNRRIEIVLLRGGVK